MTKRYIRVSAPCKIHLLGEHAVVYGKPAILAAVDLRVTMSVSPRHSGEHIRQAQCDSRIHSLGSEQVDSGQARMTDIFEPILKRELDIKEIPAYDLKIISDIPIGYGLGSSAAISVAYFGAMLTFLGEKWNLEKINALAYEAEKVFHGNPSGGDNSSVCYGGLVWFQRGDGDKKTIKPLTFTISAALSQNFVLINTGKPMESTKDMVSFVKKKYEDDPGTVQNILDNQEKLTRNLVKVVLEGNERDFIQIIKEGERNLEKLGVVSPSVATIIREIEEKGGVAKICGGGGIKNGTGVLLTYHRDPSILEGIARAHKMPFFKAALGVEGVRPE